MGRGSSSIKMAAIMMGSGRTIRWVGRGYFILLIL